MELGQIATLLGLIGVGIWIYLDRPMRRSETTNFTNYTNRDKRVEPRAKN